MLHEGIIPIPEIHHEKKIGNKLQNLGSLLEYLLKLINPNLEPLDGNQVTLKKRVEDNEHLFSNCGDVLFAIRVRNYFAHPERFVQEYTESEKKRAVEHLFRAVNEACNHRNIPQDVVDDIFSDPYAWDRFFDTHRLGDVVIGRISCFATFGAFVELEVGIEGLCHVSELSGPRVEKPEDAVKIGQKMQFKILKMDREARRIGLSARAVNPWDKFFDTHRLGDVVIGMISRFVNFGVFVELEDGIEGLCHVSELSEQHVEKSEDAVKIGQKMQFKILKMDHETRKIGLSARAVGKDEPLYNKARFLESCEDVISDLQRFSDVLTVSVKAPASAEFASIWIEFDVIEEGQHGIRIHADITIHGIVEERCLITTYFTYHDGTVLKNDSSTSNTFAIPEEKAITSKWVTVTPRIPDDRFSDVNLFTPNDELLHAPSGVHEIKAAVAVYSVRDSKWLAFSEPAPLILTVP